MAHIDFYFDFISPYAWLASKRLPELRQAGHTVHLKPLLFAGLLKQHGQKGPAEIEPKREHTYRQVLWQAHQQGLRMCLPSGHPFNPLPLLRLQLAAGNSHSAMNLIFDFVWQQGCLPSNTTAFTTLVKQCGVSDTNVLNGNDVKLALRINGDAALQARLFGVPTFRASRNRGDHDEHENFWGTDSIDMMLAWLSNNQFFDRPDWINANQLPVETARIPL
jgi:2-hydroxychromene-2-carboxylate isomerase